MRLTAVLARLLCACQGVLASARLRGRPPFAPLRRAAIVLASDRALPPLRPMATAAGFLRGTACSSHVTVDIALRQGWHALHRKFGNLFGEGLKAGDVASGKGGIPFSHQRATLFVVSHRLIIAKRFGFVKCG